MTSPVEIPLSLLTQESRRAVDVVALARLVLDNPHPCQARNGNLWLEKDGNGMIHMNRLLAEELVQCLAVYRHFFRVMQVQETAVKNQVTHQEWLRWHKEAYERAVALDNIQKRKNRDE